MAENNTQSRKWLLTINNPLEHDMSHADIKSALEKFKNLDYWCMCDEEGDECETLHTHVFFYRQNPIRFSAVKNRFPAAHIDQCRGLCADNRAYVLKDGEKYNKDAAGHYDYTDSTGKNHLGMNFSDTFEEFGVMPEERQGERTDMSKLYDLVKDGLSDFEIIDSNPRYIQQLDKIENVRQILRYEQFKNCFRELDVSYITGETGSGKTRSVMDKYGYQNVYRVTDYDHPFDSYKGQDVIIFEEFRSSLKIQDMLNYLDGYPCELPCRYSNKVACFTKVYIITNIPFTQQYANIRMESQETWRAFCRRIHHFFSCTKALGLREETEWIQMTVFENTTQKGSTA